MIDTTAKLEGWRERTDRLAHKAERYGRVEEADFIRSLMDEVEQLNNLVSIVQAARMFDRYHAFDGIRDDRCPACGGRVRIDESDPQRLRIESVPMIRAS